MSPGNYNCFSQSWKPRYGYKRGKDDTKEWCMEVPENGGQLNTLLVLGDLQL